MSHLSDEMVIRGKHIKNRIVMPPMVCFTFKGDNGGTYGIQHVEHYTQRAKGGAGLIIIQATPVLDASKKLGVWSDEQMKPLVVIAGNCHNYNAVVMMQLHCGDVNINELSIDQIHEMQTDCIAAAARVKQAGFDGVEYHFAHGFTLCKFLDPTYNQRSDQYGGALENRLRIFTEILPKIRQTVDKDFIVSVRMGGNIPDTAGAIEVARAFETAGVDLIHVSSGMKSPVNEVPRDFKGSIIAYNGSQIKRHVDVPVITVSEIFTGATAKFLVENNDADFVAIGRGMLADENWAHKVLADKPVNQCHNCGRGNTGKCLWFTDHTQCPARSKTV
jgi:2,4-dienoyl-CoA reductase-like NADH-dependent reductase (Old Yellow Enzyme family)